MPLFDSGFERSVPASLLESLDEQEREKMRSDYTRAAWADIVGSLSGSVPGYVDQFRDRSVGLLEQVNEQREAEAQAAEREQMLSGLDGMRQSGLLSDSAYEAAAGLPYDELAATVSSFAEPYTLSEGQQRGWFDRTVNQAAPKPQSVSPGSALVDRSGNVVYDQPSSDEQGVNEIMRTLKMTRPEALRYMNNYRGKDLVTDPVTGRHALHNRQTDELRYIQPDKPESIDRSWEEITQAGDPKEMGDPSQVTGVRGALWRSVNALSGALGRPPVQEDVEQAEVSLGRLRDESKITLAKRLSGRPSKYLMEMYDGMTFDPQALLTGDQRARRQLSQFRDNIQEQANQEREVLENPYQFQQERVQEAMENLRALNDLRQSYDLALEMFGTTRNPAGGRPDERGRPQDVPQTSLPRAETDAAAEQLIKSLSPGDRFIGPEGNVHRIRAPE